MYDKGTPLLEFINKFNQMSEEMENFNTQYQEMISQISFISANIIPRFADRPAIFESVQSMANSDVLAVGDICLTFNQGTEEATSKFIEVYSIDLIANRPGLTHIALKDSTLGAFLIPTNGETDAIMGQINNVNTSLEEFKSTKGQIDGLASLGADGKLKTTQMPAIDIPTYNKASSSADGLQSKEDKIKSDLYPTPSDNYKPVFKEVKTGDFNAITTTGFYQVNSSTNAPNATTAWSLIVTNSTGVDNVNFVQQMALSQADHTKMYLRRKNSSTWSSWEIFNAFNDSLKSKLDSYEFLSTSKKNVYKELKNVDFNTITDGGIYAVTSNTNAPNATTAWSLIVTNSTALDSTSHVQQVAIAENNHEKMYVRRKNSSTWSAWKEYNAYTDNEKSKLANDQVNVFLTQSAYDALSPEQKNDATKLYFIIES